MTDLYEKCDCRHPDSTADTNKCRLCNGSGFLKTGLTAGQVDMYLKRHNRLRAALVGLATLMSDRAQYERARREAQSALQDCPPACTPREGREGRDR